MRTLACALAMAALGCGGAEDSPIVQTDDGLTWSFETDAFNVPPGDQFECHYTSTITDRDLAVYGATSLQGPGGHHVLIYYTDELREPEHHPCNDGDRVSLHQIAGSAGQDVEGEVLGLRDGLALNVPAGVQLVVETHYINTSGAEFEARDAITMKLRDPEELTGYVNYMVLNDDTFEVPPLTEYENSTVCELQRDFDIVLSLSHMHEEGLHYTLDIVDEDNKPIESLRNDTWQPSYTSHPPIDYYPVAEPLALKKGTRLKQTCRWDNSQEYPLIFPREMCVAFFYYTPADGDVVCDLAQL